MSLFSFGHIQYSVDEPIIYKLSEFKKTQVMKNKQVLLKIKETQYCSVRCHVLELSNFMTILNSKAHVDPILAEHIARMRSLILQKIRFVPQ